MRKKIISTLLVGGMAFTPSLALGATITPVPGLSYAPQTTMYRMTYAERQKAIAQLYILLNALMAQIAQIQAERAMLSTMNVTQDAQKVSEITPVVEAPEPTPVPSQDYKDDAPYSH